MASELLTIPTLDEPEFPTQDVQLASANLLELVLANGQLVDQFHVGAERASWIYKVGHPALRLAAEQLWEDPSAWQAFDYGVKAYESISTLARNAPQSDDIVGINSNAVELSHNATSRQVDAFFDEARASFESDMPNTIAAVSEASQRFCGNNQRFVLIGSAAARQFELYALSEN